MMQDLTVPCLTWRAPVLAAALCLVASLAAMAQDAGSARPTALASLVIWMPFILKGFGLNLLMSVLAMAFATITGVILGFMQISPLALIRVPAKLVTHLFRNSPWLVILFAIMLLVPFQITLPGGERILIPDWVKATFGFALPVM